MFTDEQLLPISALQHLLFCRRRAALVHIEGLWSENVFTAEGRRLHDRAHDTRRGETRPGVRTERGLALCSHRLGLVGKADVVEFHQSTSSEHEGVMIVEYKRGRPGRGAGEEFRVQLCAQALCLEEMIGERIAEGALYYGKTRKRVTVEFDERLRERTLRAIDDLHALIRSGKTPTAKYERKCDRCSLKDLCLPRALRPRATAARYLARMIVEDE